MPDRMSEDMPDRMSEDMPDRMSEDLPDRMPDRLSEDMPDRMPEDMPDGMPHRYARQNVRWDDLNAMVGITRSIFWGGSNACCLCVLINCQSVFIYDPICRHSLKITLP